MKKVLIIAGSDSGAGAGIQADIRTVTAFGAYATTAITAVTAQNTSGVRGVENISPDMIGMQVDAVLEDMGADAVKTGMLSTAAAVKTVAVALARHGAHPIVVDPVMVSESGHSLLDPDAVNALTGDLFSLAALVTPNLAEAAVLVGRPVATVDEMKQAARDILDLGPTAVLVKGGHLEGDPVDVLLDDDGYLTLTTDRVPGNGNHGTGCTFASAIASLLALGWSLREAVIEAKAFLTDAIRQGWRAGAGVGQPDQLYGFKPTNRRESSIRVVRSL